MTWTIDQFTPSDGSKVQYVTVDHVAWLMRKGGGKPTIHISLNISSRDVPEAEARAILETMVAALNSAALSPDATP